MADLVVQEQKKWWQPEGFKELGAAVLSLALVILLFYTISQVFSLLDTLPKTVLVGDAIQVVDVYDRAKNLLLILFPLFSAVISFWLGVAVEGRRADANEAQALNESAKREAAEQKEATVRQQTGHVLGTMKGSLMAMSTAKIGQPSTLQGMESQCAKQNQAVEDLLKEVNVAEAAIQRQ